MKLEVRNIRKAYGEAVILDDISLSVEGGQSISISGPSGCGKSTLMSIMGLLLQPTSGEVLLDGRDITNLNDSEKSLIRRETFGFVFQSARLVGSSTVLENVLIPAVLSRDKGREKRARELLEQFGLADRMNYYPHQLSFGQTRRVSVARALIMEPKFIFPDEPTNDLDAENAAEISDILLSIPKRDGALILTTHDRAFATRAETHYSFVGKGQLTLDK